MLHKDTVETDERAKSRTYTSAKIHCSSVNNCHNRNRIDLSSNINCHIGDNYQRTASLTGYWQWRDGITGAASHPQGAGESQKDDVTCFEFLQCLDTIGYPTKACYSYSQGSLLEDHP